MLPQATSCSTESSAGDIDRLVDWPLVMKSVGNVAETLEYAASLVVEDTEHVTMKGVLGALHKGIVERTPGAETLVTLSSYW